MYSKRTLRSAGLYGIVVRWGLHYLDLCPAYPRDAIGFGSGKYGGRVNMLNLLCSPDHTWMIFAALSYHFHAERGCCHGTILFPWRQHLYRWHDLRFNSRILPRATTLPLPAWLIPMLQLQVHKVHAVDYLHHIKECFSGPNASFKFLWSSFDAEVPIVLTFSIFRNQQFGLQ